MQCVIVHHVSFVLPRHLATAPFPARVGRLSRHGRGRVGIAAIAVHRPLLWRRRTREAAGNRRERQVVKRLRRRLSSLAPRRVDLLAQVCRHGVGGRHSDCGVVIGSVVVVVCLATTKMSRMKKERCRGGVQISGSEVQYQGIMQYLILVGGRRP
jgi:hypothetical protein